MTKYDLYLTGEVGWDISAGYVKYVLDQSKGKPVKVAISSLGGYMDTALRIYELFRNHGEVYVEFLGMSASSATFMAMGAKEVKMAKNALILIHNSSSYVSEWGNRNKEQIDAIIERLKFQRSQLSTCDDVIAQIYADRNGRSVDEMKSKMKVAAWIKAEEAKELGLVDEIIDSADIKKSAATNLAASNLISDMGLPPLPKDFNLQLGEESPASSIFQRAMDMLKGLFSQSFANDSKMIKIFASAMALLSIKDGFEPNEKGDITLTQDQMKKIDDELKAQNDACLKASGVIDSLKKEVDTLKKEKSTLEQQVKDLKEGPGETGNDSTVVTEDGLTGAAALFNSIENAL